MAVTLNWLRSDPKSVKPKCVWWVAVFFLVSADFYVYSIDKDEKWVNFYIKLHGLLVKTLDWYVKGPESNPVLGINKKYTFEEIFHFLSFFWKKLLLAQKTATSQTHFSFANLGSEPHQLSATAIWNKKISNETPCSDKLWAEFT